jgi:predicted Zn-dependent protease with MMP-like domain
LIQVSDEEFQVLINQALESLPGEHVRSIANVAILYQEDPTPEQRTKLLLRHDQTLLGLYEGVPLSQRQGLTHYLPDKITLFKGPLSRRSNTPAELKEDIRHTLWHEIGHYYGLDHARISELED